MCLKHLHVIARREGIGGVAKERQCECKKEGENLRECVVILCVYMRVWVCACIYVVIRGQLLGLNLVSFVNIFVISSEFVSHSPTSHLPPPSLRDPPLPNVHMRLALCPYVSLAPSLSLVQQDDSLHLTLPASHLCPATFRSEYADLAS